MALLQGLRAFEALDAPVDIAQLAEASGYASASIKTYFSKKLEGVLVFKERDGSWRVRGALKCTERDFARRMSQKAGAAQVALETEEAWRALLRKICYEGHRRGYRLGDEELALVEKLRPRPRRRQGSLFESS